MGFSVAELKNLAVTLNTTLTQNVTLQVGESKTVVEVTASGAAIDTTTSQVGTTFDSKMLADLPTSGTGSGILNLALYTAGVSSSGAVGAGTGPSVGGQRPRNNNFTIEGIDNNSKSVTGPLATLPERCGGLIPRSIQPVLSPVRPLLRRPVQLDRQERHQRIPRHAYEYLQNRNLNAADQQSSVDRCRPQPRYDNNRFGGALGGPIKKNKIFFFF